ncbi:hypothetical protein [Devosia sp. 2618]|uniref:hypothetical protein n=1 Tax=Devosia sp. 2618 TaxID=3156454 RepID=UPI0033989FE3
MRGLFSFGRALINEAKEFGVGGAIANLWADACEAMSVHFANHLGGSDVSGIYARVPFTRLSLWVEHREVSVGLGLERGAGQLEFFLGRIQGVLCVEPAAVR